MKEQQIVLNTESVLDYLNCDSQIPVALKAAREAGYQSVELWHVATPEHNAPWRPFLDEADLRCCALHELFEEVAEAPEKTIQKAHSLDCSVLAIGRSRDTVWTDLESVKKFAASMNALGKQFRDQGIALLYHNHNTEFVHTAGKIALDIFFEETDPDLVGSELDAYWVQLSGADPVSWCQKLGRRLQVLHLKDVRVVDADPESFIKRPVCTTLGLGNLDLRAIVGAAEADGCLWYAVETCTDWIDNDSLRCMRESFAFLRDNFCR